MPDAVVEVTNRVPAEPMVEGDFGTFLINLLLADIDLRKLYVALAAAAVAHIF